MKTKDQFKIAFKMINMPLMMAMTLGYAIGYGILFGSIIRTGNWQFIIFQTCLWMLFYGYLFMPIAGGVGIINIFYTLISFGKDRKTAFLVWTKTLWFSFLLSAGTLAISVLIGGFVLKQGERIMFLGLSLSEKELNFMQMLFDGGGIPLVGIIGLLLGLGVFLNVLLAFFCTIGFRFGWEITAGVVLLMISLILVVFVADINILFVTGHNIYRYVFLMYGFIVGLLTAIYFLSQKWEVKN